MCACVRVRVCLCVPVYVIIMIICVCYYYVIIIVCACVRALLCVRAGGCVVCIYLYSTHSRMTSNIMISVLGLF